MPEFFMGQPGIQMGNLGEGGDVRLYNSGSINLPKFHIALNNVKNGTGTARIICVGDSITFGYGSAGSNVVALSYPKKLSDNFNSNSVNAQWNSFMGPGGPLSSVDYAHQDSRLVIGTTGWSFNTYPTFVPGGYPGLATSAATQTTFTPTVNVDTFRVWYISTTSGGLNGGSIAANINGGTNTIVATNTGTSGIGSFTITTTLGSNTLNINWSSGNGVYYVGTEAFNSAVKAISIINTGITGASTSTWTSDPSDQYGLPIGLSKLGQDLTIINLGVNDWQSGSDAGVGFTTNLQAVITQAAVSGGDVVLTTPIPSNTGVVSTARQQTYVNAINALGATNNIPVIDHFTQFGSWATANSNGWMFDNLHPNATGYAQMALKIYNTISGA